MPNQKTALALLLSLCMLFALAGYALAAGFSDVRGHWAEGQINKWAEKGLAGGYSDGTFRPNNDVTRAEFVALTNRAFGIKTRGAAGFSDVAAGQWYYGDIAAAVAAGYTGGYPGGAFKPGQSISRQEVASIMVRLLKLEPATGGLEKFNDASRIPQWSRSSIGAVVKAGLMGGYPDGTFQPGQSITRAEAVVTLDRALGSAPVVTEDAYLQGTVKLADKAVGGATVRVFEAGSYELLKETGTDGQGYFKLPLAAGSYDITAVTGNKAAYQSNIVLARDKSAAVNLDLAPAAVISGTLYDEGGSKVKEARLLFTTNPTFVLVTGDDGRFSGAVLPDRTYTVRAYKPGKEDEEPVIVSEALAVGAAGNRSVGMLTAPYTVSVAPGGGGGGGGGGGTAEPVELGAGDIEAGKTYSDSHGYIIKSFGAFGPASGVAVFTTKLTIDPGDSGTLTLRNIKAGAIEILSGGTNSVHTENFEADTLTVKAANGVKIEAGSGTVITETEVEGETHIAVASGATFGSIKIKSAAGGKNIAFSGDLSGSTVTVETGNVTLRANSGAQMGKVIIDKPGTINLAGQGRFGDVEVSANAGQGGRPVINVAQGTPVTKLTLSTTVELTGDVADIDLEVTDPDEVEIIVNDPDTKNELITQAVEKATGAIAVIKSTVTLADEAAVVSARNKANAVAALGGSVGAIGNIAKLNNAEAVIKALKAISIGYAAGDSAAGVTKNITLPAAAGGLAVTWTSSKTNVIGTDGQVTRQENNVSVTLTAAVTKGGINGNKTFTVTVKGTVSLPRITSFAGTAPGAGNIITVPLSAIHPDTGIEVSMDSKLALNVEGLGPVRQLDLKTGQVNNIYNILVPGVEEIDLSQLDLNALFQATAQCPPATKEQIVKAVNFTGLFELLRGTGIKDAVISETDLDELLETVAGDDSINKGDILAAVNLDEVVEALRGQITKDDITTIISKEDLVDIIADIDDDGLQGEIVDAMADVLNAETDNEMADALQEFFRLILQTEESVKDAILREISFTALFEVVKNADSAAVEDAFNAIDLAALFGAISGAGDGTINKIVDVTMQIIVIMQQYNITKDDILNNIQFNELDKEELFDWLSRIDGDNSVLTMEAVLTDSHNASNKNTYTININK